MIFTAKKLVERYLAASRETYQLYQDWLSPAAITIVAIHIFYHFFNLYFDESEPLTFRGIAVLMVTPFILHRPISKTRFATWLPSLLLFALFISGPLFLFIGILVELSIDEPNKLVLFKRQFEFVALLGLFLLVCTDIAFFSLISIASFFLAIATFAWTKEFNLDISSLSWLATSSIYIFFYMGLVISARRKSDRENSRAEAAAMLGSSIAHELRTPLLSIRTRAEALNSFAPKLFKRDSISSEISPRKLELLQESTAVISEEVSAANTLIDIFLVNASSYPYSISQIEEFDIQTAIKEAVSRYPYRSNRERDSVVLNLDCPHRLVGPKVLFIHVIFNLMKNSFEHMGKCHDPKLEIALSKQNQKVELYLTDNGSGVEKQNLDRIFLPYFSTTLQGSGIGLSFCKQTLKNLFSANISCISKPGSFTKMAISFSTDKS